jgi:hypothetical protein
LLTCSATTLSINPWPPPTPITRLINNPFDVTKYWIIWSRMTATGEVFSPETKAATCEMDEAALFWLRLYASPLVKVTFLPGMSTAETTPNAAEFCEVNA